MSVKKMILSIRSKKSSKSSAAASADEFQLNYYWGALSKETEIQILSKCRDGSYLLRDCHSDPDLFTLAVKNGSRIYRYRCCVSVAMEMIRMGESCSDGDGHLVVFTRPILRPKNYPPASPKTERSYVELLES
eukprot:scpid60951/ scgid14772/ 